MRALVGDDNSLWKPLPGYFTPGTPLYNEEGGEILKGPRDLAAAKKLLAESGYTGQPVTCVVAQDQPITKAQGDVTAELLKRLGMNVDFVAIDWGTTGRAARRSRRPDRAAGRCSTRGTPAPTASIRRSTSRSAPTATGAWFGWPNVPEVEKEVTPGSRRRTSTKRRRPSRRLNKAALDNVVYAPTGFFLTYQAWRKNVSGIVKGPLPFFWDVVKSA